MLLFFKVERVASMLNYFLLQLVGPQRKSLTLKDPEKYEFRPKHLLKQVGIDYIWSLVFSLFPPFPGESLDYMLLPGGLCFCNKLIKFMFLFLDYVTELGII